MKDSSGSCPIGFSSIESGWKECKSAAETIGFKFSGDTLMDCKPTAKEDECQRCFYFRNNTCLLDIECGTNGDQMSVGNAKALCKRGKYR